MEEYPKVLLQKRVKTLNNTYIIIGDEIPWKTRLPIRKEEGKLLKEGKTRPSYEGTEKHILIVILIIFRSFWKNRNPKNPKKKNYKISKRLTIVCSRPFILQFSFQSSKMYSRFSIFSDLYFARDLWSNISNAYSTKLQIVK